MTPFQQAHEDARRLTKRTGRDVEVATVHCCEYDKTCNCGGEGISYELLYSFCQHVVQDGDDLECQNSDCEWREYQAFIQRDGELEQARVA